MPQAGNNFAVICIYTKMKRHRKQQQLIDTLIRSGDNRLTSADYVSYVIYGLIFFRQRGDLCTCPVLSFP